MIDTLRADHLSAYGYERNTSPNIDRLADESYLFEDVTAVSPWTNPSIGTLFTGRNPQSIWPPANHRQAISMPLPGEIPTLAERFRDAGFRTIGLVDHPGINQRLEFSRGFDEYSLLFREGGFPIWQDTDSAFVRERVREALESVGSEPFLLYLHLVYPHQPYIAPEPHQGAFGEENDGKQGRRRRLEVRKMINAYDAEILYTDALVGEIVSDLAQLGLDPSTWVVLVSDHGEAFGEHRRFEHGNSFFDEVLRVPLILRPPGGLRSQRRITDPVSILDVHPTLLAIAGITVPKGLRGVPLLGFRAPEADRWLFSESPHAGDIHGGAVRRGPWKYIEYGNRSRGRRVLVNLAEDPGETKNLVATDDRAERLRRSLMEHLEASEIARSVLLEEETIEVDAETIERLRALGYID
jgi:arylsulfatase A-like enzyme